MRVRSCFFADWEIGFRCKYTFSLPKKKWLIPRAHLHTIGTEGILLRDGEERLVQLRRSHRRRRLGGKRDGQRAPFELEKPLFRVIAVLVLPMRLGDLEHEPFQAVDAPEVQPEQAPEVRGPDHERDLLGDVLQGQVEQVPRDVDREVLEVEVGDHHVCLERALDAELVHRRAEWVCGCYTVLWEDAVVDEEEECLSHESRRGIECRGIEVVQRVQRKVDNVRV